MGTPEAAEEREFRTRAARSWWIGLALGVLSFGLAAHEVLAPGGEGIGKSLEAVLAGVVCVVTAVAMRRSPPYLVLRKDEFEIRVGRRKAVLPFAQFASLKEGRLSLVVRLRDGTAYPVSLWRLRAQDRIELVLALRKALPLA